MMKKPKNNKLTLPCLRGAIGDWIYYSVIVPFSELSRIDNEHVIKEAKSLDRYLQRTLSNRTKDIKNYLLNENERYFNSVIVGVYKDMPDWYALDLSQIAKKFKLQIKNNIEESLGILSLTGNEILFTIDGQHRIEGIKLALQENSEEFKNDELSVVLVAHKDDVEGRVRTRKLFATINRLAVRPTQNDLAIIDEVYAYNIIARMLYAEYPKFKNKISLTASTNIDRRDHDHFINLLTLVAVNKSILKLANYKQSIYNGPNLNERKELYAIATEFWDFVTKNIQLYKKYFSGQLKLNEVRNSERGKPLNLLFQPIGMDLIAYLYVHFYKNANLEILKDKINKIDFDLYKGHYAHIYFNPHDNGMITNKKRLGRNLSLYLLDQAEYLEKSQLKIDLAISQGISENDSKFTTFKLPKQIS